MRNRLLAFTACLAVFALAQACSHRATAELFGAGVTGNHARQRQVRSVDGTLDACRQASPDASC